MAINPSHPADSECQCYRLKPRLSLFRALFNVIIYNLCTLYIYISLDTNYSQVVSTRRTGTFSGTGTCVGRKKKEKRTFWSHFFENFLSQVKTALTLDSQFTLTLNQGYSHAARRISSFSHDFPVLDTQYYYEWKTVLLYRV